MQRWQVIALVAAAAAVVLLLAQALSPPARAPAMRQAPVAAAPAPRPEEAPPADGLTPEQRQAEERLLDERVFSHPVKQIPAPGAQVLAPDGRATRLAPARGKVVLVNFWATWCPPCVAEMPSLVKLGRELAAAHPDDFRMVAVSGDDSWDAVHAYFKKSFGDEPRFLQLVRDPDAAAARAWYCAARGYCPDVKFPETYLVDRSGRIVAMMVGARDWSDPAARQLIEFLIKG